MLSDFLDIIFCANCHSYFVTGAFDSNIIESVRKMRAEVVSMSAGHLDREALRRAGRILKDGGLVAFPTETVYGLGGNALDPQASMKIYAAKGRPSDNPLIVHIAEMEKLPYLVTEVPEKAKILAEKYWPGPLTMILPKADTVPKETTGGLDSVAVRFPSDEIAQELIKEAGGYVAAPSANTSGRPSPTTAQHVEEDLGDAIDMIIDGGQVGIGLESTIVDFTEEIPVVLRPGYISLEMLKETLGEVRMDQGLIQPDSGIRPKAPGMKYRHYAPKADLLIVEGSEEAVIAEINRRAEEAGDGLPVGIIATDETIARYPKGIVKSIGSRNEEESIAHHLYEVLRQFDDCQVSTIYSEAFYTPRMGQAIMNRLLKAAGHKVIHV
jgi:L-threonylcarbamoyladenylate synthase